MSTHGGGCTCPGFHGESENGDNGGSYVHGTLMVTTKHEIELTMIGLANLNKT